MKYNAHKFIRVILLTATLYTLTSLPIASFVGSAIAACSGTGCNGLFPDSSGCSTNGTQSIIAQVLPASAQVDLRYSGGCKTVWARTTNVDYPYGRSFYLNATLKGYYTISSPGVLAPGQVVFTQQRYVPSLPTSIKACGRIGTSHITGPLTTPCTP
ncbi:MAG: DUF2690 domain-containing protein [Anaerolineales bacterium]|nr:DUF2690 domain-containing protein [Anaerolineales bacterium]